MDSGDSSKPKKNYGVPTPFEELEISLANWEAGLPLVEGEATQEIKLQNGEEKRTHFNRFDVPAGAAVIYEPSGRIIAKGRVKNLSPGGAGLEIPLSHLEEGTKVMVDFGGKGVNLGTLRCTVQWVTPVKDSYEKRLQVGLKFMRLPPRAKRILDEFFSEIKVIAGSWS